MQVPYQTGIQSPNLVTVRGPSQSFISVPPQNEYGPYRYGAQQNVVQHNVAQQNVAQQNVAQQNVAQQNVAQQNVTQQNLTHHKMNEDGGQQNIYKSNEVEVPAHLDNRPNSLGAAGAEESLNDLGTSNAKNLANDEDHKEGSITPASVNDPHHHGINNAADSSELSDVSSSLDGEGPSDNTIPKALLHPPAAEEVHEVYEAPEAEEVPDAEETKEDKDIENNEDCKELENALDSNEVQEVEDILDNQEAADSAPNNNVVEDLYSNSNDF